jgi:hypothetical protein
MGDPTSSYAAADIALEFIGARKPPHAATKCFRQGGDTIDGERHSNIRKKEVSAKKQKETLRLF